MANEIAGSKTGRRGRAIPWLVVAGVAAVLACLNVAPRGGGSAAFEEEHSSGFARSRGWPMRSWTFADDEGLALVDASVVMSGNVVRRDLLPGKAYPHLVIQPLFVGVDAVAAIVLLGLSWFVGHRIAARAATAAKHPQAAS